MKKTALTLPLALVLGMGLCGLGVYARSLQAPKTPTLIADPTTKSVVAAADALLATLTPEQRKAVSFAFTDSQQRVRWSNLPTGIVQRAGLRMGDLNETQQKAVHALLQAILSKQGYQKVVDIVNGDEVLRQTDGGGRLIFGKAEYYLSFLGKPSATSPWMFQFGGHHLAVNATVVGKDITLAPSLPAAQPAKYTLGGKTIQPLGRELSKGFALIQALTPEQQKTAIRAPYFIDLVLGPGQDGKTLAPEGIPGSALTEPQKKLLLDLMAEWIGNVNDNDAAPKLAAAKANLDKTYFAWGGPTTTGSAAYYRVTGPTIVLEYSPQRMGGDGTGHTHCIYREPGNDYGAALTK
ncbi:DUF3500 domain-containing protein [Armatimonas rosea]|uniref:DUF3500 domain-containing protein n=1 Tax=Armatimonas rosea TaxID=685828 RepID=A0A7W9W7R5_ARMRO|nr:DUF3500 domain-containing protein [Armatimonas rosea]MBB6051496.1 hypothetical protein [Armatimonas rosea]